MELQNAIGHGNPLYTGELRDLSTLDIALSPLDARYRKYTSELQNYLSEPALNRARLYIEIEWFIYLCNLQKIKHVEPLNVEEMACLRKLVTDFGEETIAELAKLEKVTAHDVKAVEYYLKLKLDELSQKNLFDKDVSQYKELVHFGCTSEDVNNLAYALNIKNAFNSVWLPAVLQLMRELEKSAELCAALPMLARTHGQPASPTTLGKELAVFGHRLRSVVERAKNITIFGKFNGATGTYGAYYVAFPDIDWRKVTKNFINQLKLTQNPLTTQIESHDWQVDLYNQIVHANNIMLDFATDMWSYISLSYFTEAPVAGEIGSSAMPHKINPIRFENAEANLQISNSLFTSFTNSLPKSRFQRDLSDSSTQRNIGSAFAYSLIAIYNLLEGWKRIAVNRAVIADDLESNPQVLSEAIQSVLRAAIITGETSCKSPYEALKTLTRGNDITKKSLHDFIKTLDLPAATKSMLLNLSPSDYTGIAEKLVI
ncbi:MAG: adenylosuccinate lyase [Bifidobacteriaceae bacterium]|jgi:adenylosuccinate lyase|nr:adenylosuccinate lyase [Bifidobacteriaceae bacterium]